MPKRALIVKFGSIGDVVMALPAAAALHAEGFGVDWVISRAIVPLLQLFPWIRTIPVDEAALLRGPVPDRLRAAGSLWRQLHAGTRRSGAYDLLATLYYDRRYDLLTAGIAARRRVRLLRDDRHFALLPGRHHTDEYARLLLGYADGERPFQLPPLVPLALPAFPEAAVEARPRIVLVPAGARNVQRDDALRRWPVQHYVALAALLLERGFAVDLAGGPEDGWASAHFAPLLAASAPSAGTLVDRIGSLDLPGLLSLLDAAAVTVTHDTGPLHLAGMTRTAIVSLFGPTDPRGRIPRRPDVVALWGGEDFACRPCYDGRDYAPCLHNGCMTRIAPERVLEEVLRLWQARKEGASSPVQVKGLAHASLVSLDGGPLA